MQNAPRSRFVLPLPSFVLHPYTAIFIAAVHVYLSVGHLSHLFGGDVQWTHFWKGIGSLGGAYVFAALASRGLARGRNANEKGTTLRPFRQEVWSGNSSDFETPPSRDGQDKMSVPSGT